ncbi:DMT family transporter [Treponema pectinovorum]|uniref:DMT family transporter n=1 Tax=Treponema pectinovorum TaxID=164 RepID=UPI0011F3E347|nr:DMT family transporter [Treponema pectinovorum]
MTQSKTSLKGILILLLTALIWGSAFIAQSEGASHVKPFTFNSIRTLIGAFSLLPVIFLKERFTFGSKTKEAREQRRLDDKKIFVYGTFMGLALCFASNFQQFAFVDPNHSSGKIAFITATYMFLVPIIGIFLKKRVSIVTWVCVFIGFLGLYFLCIDERGLGSITQSDILAFICAFFFAIQILLIERFAPGLDGVKLSCVQFFVSGLITFVLMFIFEKPNLTSIKSAGIPILYAGIMSSGVAYTLQVIGQQFCEATLASLIMCMESVFAVLMEAAFAVFFLAGGKILSLREIFGCSIMFFAIILSQLAQIFVQKKARNF